MKKLTLLLLFSLTSVSRGHDDEHWTKIVNGSDAAIGQFPYMVSGGGGGQRCAFV